MIFVLLIEYQFNCSEKTKTTVLLDQNWKIIVDK